MSLTPTNPWPGLELPLERPRKTTTLQRGGKIGGYELVAPLGEGGMATVWLARRMTNLGFSRMVALKAMQSTFSGNAEYRQMFLDEAAIAARLHHPNVGIVFDLIEDDGRLFIGLEWIEGDSLNSLFDSALARGEMIPSGIALRIIADACAGLHAVHELADDHGTLINAVHRDISPHNIVVAMSGVTKIIDFGIAKSSERLVKETALGVVKGKVRYLSPEQVRSEIVDRRTDIWAMGTVLYRILTGRFRFEGDDRQVLLDLMAGAPKAAPLPNRIPKEVRDVVERALASNKEERFQTAHEMRVAIENAMRATDLVTLSSDVEEYLRGPAGDRSRARRASLNSILRPALEIVPAEDDVTDVTEPRKVLAEEARTKLDSPGAFRPVAIDLPARRVSKSGRRPITLTKPSRIDLPPSDSKPSPRSKRLRWTAYAPKALAAWALSVAATMIVVVECSRISSANPHRVANDQQPAPEAESQRTAISASVAAVQRAQTHADGGAPATQGRK